MSVTNISSEWVSGSLVFYETAVGQSVTGDVLTLGTTAVKIGGTSQDVDFQWYATGSKSFILDAGAGTLVMSGLDVTITGDLTIDTEDINLGDGDDLEFGDSQDVLMRFSLADVSNPAFVLALDDTSQQMHITDKAAVATDWARSAGTHPELAIHSNTTPITDYLAIGNHDGTTAHIDVVGGTTLSLDIAGTPYATITATVLTLSAGITVGVSGAGYDVTFYGDTVGCNFLWDQNLDTNGGLQLGADTKATSFYAYGLTTGNLLKWDAANDDLVITGTAARVLHGADAAGNDVIFYGAVASYATTFDANGDTNGSWAFGADTKGMMVSLYGDITGCGVFWDPSTDTNGTLTIGGSGGSKGNDIIAYGATNGNYFHWDQSADDLLLVGTATQLAVAGTTEATSTTTGSLRTAGGLACVGDFYAGDDIFMPADGVINFGAGDVTITGGTNTLAFAGASAGVTFDGLTAVTVASLNATTGRIAKFDGTVLTPNFGDGYGAVECNLNIGTGAVAGHVAAMSSWINLASDTTFTSLGYCVSPLDVGIWGPSGTLTNGKFIMGLKMSCVIDDGANPGELYLFNTNIFDNATTALFDINTIVDFTATASAAATGAYKLPFLKERSTGTTWYMNIYTS